MFAFSMFLGRLTSRPMRLPNWDTNFPLKLSGSLVCRYQSALPFISTSLGIPAREALSCNLFFRI
ncbi:unnamed protein product [Prunus brigantina]